MSYITPDCRWKIEEYLSSMIETCGVTRWKICIYKDGFWQSYRDEPTFNSALKFLRNKHYISVDEYTKNLKVRG